MSEPLKFPMALASEPLRRSYAFGPFRLDPARRLLLREGQTVPLTPRVFDTLLALVENSGRVVEKDELMERLWPDTVVEEANLTVNVSTLRKALGESTVEHKYIATIPGRGYRFVADVKVVIEEEDAAPGKGINVRAAARELKSDNQPTESRAPEQKAIAQPSHAPARSHLTRSRLAIGALAIIAIGLAVYLWLSPRSQTVGAGSPVKSLAVLPFRLFGSAETYEYLGMGIADRIIMRLGYIKQVRVRPIGAVTKYNNPEQDPVAAGRELSVEAVLDGSIRQSGERIRVTAQLVSIETGSQLWAGVFDENLSELFALEDRVSARVAEALTLNLTGEEEEQIVRRYTVNPEAYIEYLKGRVYWNMRTSESIKKGIGHFSRAIEIDPNFAPGYAGLADSHALLSYRTYSSLPPHETMPKAKVAAMKALEIDETLAEAHTSLGLVKWRYEWDWRGAEEEFKRAIALNPGYATAHQWYADLLSALGRTDEAIAEIKLAKEADPSSLIISAVSSMPFYHARQYDRVIEQSRNTLAIDPEFPVAHFILGLAYEQKGSFAMAIAEIEKAKEILTGGAAEAYLGYLYAVSGRKGEALKKLEELKGLSNGTYVSPFLVATIYSGLRDGDRTIEWLKRACLHRSTPLVYLKVDPKYDWLRADARFASLLRRIGLEP